MLATKYTIIGRYMDGVKVIGYELETTDGAKISLPKKTVEELALNKQILNCTAQKYVHPETSKVIVVLKGIGCKLSSLPSKNISKAKTKVDTRGVITERIVNGKNTVGYIVRWHTGETREYKREDILKLAREGYLKNARAQMLKGRLLLRGTDCELAKLPARKVSELKKKEFA